MTIPETITSLVGKWKLYLALLGAVVIVAGAIYLKGHSDGVDQTNDKWKAEIANAKPVEVRRDTTLTTQKPDSGKFIAQQASLTKKYQRRIDQVVFEAGQIHAKLESVADSLEQVNRNLETVLRAALSPKLIHLETPEIGDLLIQYFPADSSANVYKHIPPPVKTVTVYTEKLVTEPRSDWETVGYIALGTGIGVLAAILTKAH